jgi:UDP-N-acetylmuramyl tripeptide synthase
MQFLDARRLTGPSLLFDGPAAILDIECEPGEADAVEAIWRASVGRMVESLGWPEPGYSRVDLEGGASFAFTVPIDCLYAASELNEWAWQVIDAELNGADAPDFETTRATLAESRAEEANAELLELETLAAERGVTFLWDDDEASLGLGRTAQTWPARELPDPDSLDWSSFEDVPIGLVTGTNGKTTAVRVATHILQSAGLRVGLSSTDWIAVDDRVIDRGDWSGPGGARAVLRQPDVDAAILESARGGLLRRGLGVTHADAALITNISEDHLGDFGSQTIEELLEIKWIISRAVRERGVLVLNADDERLVARAASYPGRICWFGLDPQIEAMARVLKAGGPAYVLDGGELVRVIDGKREFICADRDISITLGGAARHNTANALAAAALTDVLGASLDAIREGLVSMSQDVNPGRCNIYDADGTRVLVDFAHNPAAMSALFDMARALPANRRVLCFGQAGDRTDALIHELAQDAFAIGLDRVIVSELAHYHRGRAHGEVYGLIRDELLRLGLTADQVEHHETEIESFTAALEWAEAGDLVIMLALGGAAPIHDELRARGVL